mgnify:CR=1 FL=1
MSRIDIAKVVNSPGAPAVGYGRLYVKSDGLHFVSDSGQDRLISSTSGMTSVSLNGSVIGTREIINFLNSYSDGVLVSIQDDPQNNCVNITITSSGGEAVQRSWMNL